MKRKEHCCEHAARAFAEKKAKEKRKAEKEIRQQQQEEQKLKSVECGHCYQYVEKSLIGKEVFKDDLYGYEWGCNGCVDVDQYGRAVPKHLWACYVPTCKSLGSELHDMNFYDCTECGHSICANHIDGFYGVCFGDPNNEEFKCVKCALEDWKKNVANAQVEIDKLKPVIEPEDQWSP